ncbi:uncharacterized protein FIBRA_04799 [Fibroporia radiculosa]|uniref:Uncharacterized protein n=1 Tax=Fibroporia radiculosa TaxID=599839 RepID=J4G7Z2_9APHY|nr:uncharacterized protein FIBRA_04799 [Fibroporia radiculosa]CCM02693.1 predicted protein [Fibroporia radiculosa]
MLDLFVVTFPSVVAFERLVRALPHLSSLKWVTFASILFGINSLQVLVYRGKSKSDTVLLKSLIGFLWILDFVDLVLLAQIIYQRTITAHAILEVAKQPAWNMTVNSPLNAHFLLASLIEGIAFMLENMDFGRNKFMVSAVVFSSISAFGMADPLFSCIRSHNRHLLVEGSPSGGSSLPTTCFGLQIPP